MDDIYPDPNLENRDDLAEDFIYPDASAETVSPYREAAIRALSHVLEVGNFLLEAKSDRELRIRLYALAHGVGHPALAGESITATAARIRTTRANLSKSILLFQRQTGLPAVIGQKSETARRSFSQARRRQLRQS